MKIALIRYSLRYPLTFEEHTEETGGAEEMVTFLIEAHKAGHEIHLHCQARDEDSFKDEERLHQYPHLEAMKYRPFEIPDDDCDLLMMMPGADNMMFGRRTDQIPDIVWSHFILKHYKGLVFYNHYDFDLPILFNPFFMKAFIPYCNVTTPSSLYEGKQFVMLTKLTRNFEDFYTNPVSNNNKRHTYDSVRPPVEFFPSSVWGIQAATGNKKMDIHPNPSKTLVYAGQEKRVKTVRKYYSNSPFDYHIYGKWREKTLDNFEGELTYHGGVPQEQLGGILNDSIAQVTTGSPLYENYGVLMPRYFETIASRCASFLDSKLVPDKEIIPIDPFFVINSQEELNHKVNKMKNYPDVRRNLLEMQKESLESLDMSLPIKYIEKYVEKYYSRPFDEIDGYQVAIDRFDEKKLLDRRRKHRLMKLKAGAFVEEDPYKRCKKCGNFIDAQRTYAHETCVNCGGESPMAVPGETEIRKAKVRSDKLVDRLVGIEKQLLEDGTTYLENKFDK